MNSKRLKELRSRLLLIERFLSVPPVGPHLSVWNLKQFLEINDPMDHLLILSVNVDYGFISCRTFEETCTLIEIYRKVRKTVNPLELHQTCVAGDSFQFGSGYVRMKEPWRSLMRNFYLGNKVVESELGPELRSKVGSEIGSEVGSEVG